MSRIQNSSVGSHLLWAFVAAAGAACSAHATVFSYTTLMDGPSESPPVPSPATGIATVNYDDVLHTLNMHVEFSGLLAPTTAAHIHATTAIPRAGTAGVAVHPPSLTGFPLGVTAGIYDNTFDLTLASSYSAAFIAANGGTPAGAEAGLAASMAAGRAYFNIHSSAFGSGEIRGFLPAPGAAMLLGMAGVIGLRRRR